MEVELERSREKLNPFKDAEAEWAMSLVSSLKTQLDERAHEIQAKLSESWEQAEQEGHDRGYAEGEADAKAKLQKKHEKALAEHDMAAQKALADLEARLKLEFESVLQQCEANVRREVEQQLKAAFDEDLALAESQLREAFAVELEAARAEAKREAEAPLNAELGRLQQEMNEQQSRFDQELAAAIAKAKLDAREAIPQEPSELRSTVPAQANASGAQGASEAPAPVDGYDEGLQEGLRRLDEYKSQVLLEKRAAQEEGYQKGHAEASRHTEQDIKAAYDEGYQKGQHDAERAASKELDALAASSVVMDEAKRQGYQSGYEDGRSVGLAKGRREAESAYAHKLQEANRQGYREGYADGRRQAGGGERAWALGILHLSDAATAAEIKQHYKKLSMLLHPDQNPGVADDYIKNLNRAKDLLGI